MLFAGKSARRAGLRNCQVLDILRKARAFLSTTTQSSCFKRPGVYPGLLRKRVLYDVTAVLPGPKLFRPVHQKSSVSLGKVRPISQKHQCSVLSLFCYFLGTFGHIYFFFLSPFWAFWPEFQPPGNTASQLVGWWGWGGLSALHTEIFHNRCSTCNCMTFCQWRLC